MFVHQVRRRYVWSRGSGIGNVPCWLLADYGAAPFFPHEKWFNMVEGCKAAGRPVSPPLTRPGFRLDCRPTHPIGAH
jgi:hypothetical protein